MSLGETLLRSLQRIGSSPHSASEIERVGALGEAMAAAAIAPTAGSQAVYNPLIPHPRRPGAWLESDVLLYTHGKLFCIEVKNYRGIISYPSGQWGAEATGIVQSKTGRFGDVMSTKEHPNPLRKTKGFVYDLKQFLGHIDRRFARFYINAVVAFGPMANISAIRDPAVGVIALSELDAYLSYPVYGQPAGPGAIPEVIAAMFAQVPSWDWVCTTRGEWHNGVLAPPGLEYTSGAGRPMIVRWPDLGSVALRPGHLFGDDTLVLHLRNGQMVEDRCRRGQLALDRGGQRQSYDLHHLRDIVIKVSGMRWPVPG